MEFEPPKIDPQVLEISRQIVENQKRSAKKAERHEHRYDIAALAVSFASFFVAVASLVFAILAYLK